MDNALINTAATHETRNERQEGVPKPSASPVLGGSCAPSTSTNLASRLVQIALALYLIPALLIVLLVGAVGMLVVGMVRLFIRLLGATSGWSEARAGTYPPAGGVISFGRSRSGPR
jgi:hypothetical protein